MNRYEAQVEETRHYTVRYVVEARTYAEAEDKLEMGDTVEEEELAFVGVIGRRSTSMPVRVIND